MAEIFEDAIKQKEEEIRRVEAMNNREIQLRQEEEKLQQRKRDLDEREQQHEQWIAKMSENKEKMMNRVTLNVGGTLFTTSKATLLSIKGCYFESMISSGNFQPDEKNEFFVDRDPKYFSVILNFMRDGTLRMTHVKRKELDELKQDFHFYGLNPFSQFPFLSLPLQQTISKWLPHKAFKLLYKATKDGFEVKTFHHHCDKRGPTLSIVESTEGYWFGGYTGADWESVDHMLAKLGHDSFLFSLINPHALPPTKYHLQPAVNAREANAIMCNEKYGIMFGLTNINNDMCVQMQDKEAFFFFPQSYVDTTGKGQETFTGKYKSPTKEIMVFSVRPSS